MFLVSEEWREAYPGALAGILVMRGVVNPAVHPRIDRQREELEGEPQHRFAGADRGALAALPVIRAYTSYYKRFDKTYHASSSKRSHTGAEGCCGGSPMAKANGKPIEAKTRHPPREAGSAPSSPRTGIIRRWISPPCIFPRAPRRGDTALPSGGIVRDERPGRTPGS